MTARRPIAYVECATPPAAVTLAEWFQWRQAEDMRMFTELAHQIGNYLVLAAARRNDETLN